MILGKNSTVAPQTLLPLLLNIAGKAVKIPLGEGDDIFISLIRLLGAITSNCDAAARQCFDDPSNFFLMDLASVGSDSLGVSSSIQTIVCFFVGNCFAALQDQTSTSTSMEGTITQDSTLLLNKKSFLSVIDTRIGLTRFNELLRRPFKVAHTTNNNNHNNDNNNSSSSCSGEMNIDTTDQFFFTRGFEDFYRSQVESIRSAIFTFYSGGDGGMKSIMESQEIRIAELENLLILNKLSSPVVSSSDSGGSDSDKKNINRGVNIDDSNSNGNEDGEKEKDKKREGGDEGEWDWDGAEEEEHRHQVEVEVESDEKGGLNKKRKAEGNSSRTIMTEEEYSLRISELESSLYESDKEVIALQQALLEKQQQQEEQLQQQQQSGGGYNQFEMHREGVEPSYDLKSDHSGAGMWSVIQSYIIILIHLRLNHRTISNRSACCLLHSYTLSYISY